MKQPKKLTRQMKEKLTKLKLDATEWMLVSDTNDKTTFTIINKNNGNLKIINY